MSDDGKSGVCEKAGAMNKSTIESTGTATLAAAAHPRVAELMQDRNGMLPVWVRAPKGGPEHYTGFSRSKLYDLAAKRLIRSVSVREPGRVSGTRLFELASILAYIETAVEAAA